MTIISLIAAIDEAGGLGRGNQLLCHLPADLQHFKAITMGKPVIMGRKTYESIGRPLPGRLNIVISNSQKHIEGVVVVPSILEAIEQAEDAEEVMIIGGANIYRQTIEMATRIYLTQIHHRFDADVFFPQIDESAWDCQSKRQRDADDKNPFEMTFFQYERR